MGPFRSIATWTSVPNVLALVLLGAAALKQYQLAMGPVLATDLWTSRSFLMGWVEIEVALGLWLLSGLYPGWGRFVAIVCFSGFLELSLYQGLSGKTSCGCFGKLSVSPWIILTIDCFAVLGLLCWQAKQTPSAPSSRHRWRLAGLVGGFLVVAIPGWMSMSSYRGITPALRRDLALNKPVTLDLVNPKAEEILERIRERTKVRVTLAPNIPQETAVFPELKLPEVRARALMELIVERQSVNTRWVKEADGYRLVRVPYPRVGPWIPAILLLAVGAANKALAARTLLEESVRNR